MGTSGITIAIATFDRADELRLTLVGLARLEDADLIPHEVLVVANRCTDHTADVVHELQGHLGDRLRIVHELEQGLSHARNRAVHEARYDVIAFLDDDVDVDPSWLRSLRAAYEGADFAAVGGRAYLSYPGDRPGWLSDLTEGLLTKVERGPTRRTAGADELYGLNLAVRKEWIERVGGFRTDLGRVGHCLIGSEETELLDRIAKAGGSLLYEPAAVVGHRVPPERLRRRWFWSRVYWGRLGDTRMLAEDEVGLYSLTRALWRFARAGGGAAVSLLAAGPMSREFFEHATKVVARWGDLAGLVIRLATALGRRVAPSRPATT